MQARVEPAFLQDALRDVAALYETDRKTGGHLLDLLILYLRTALPQMRKSDSTLEREVGLLRAYLGILALRSGGELAVACNFDPALAEARFPPMVLVPLVATMTRANASAGVIKVDAHGPDHRLRIAIAASGAITRAVAESAALRDVHERLAALYGERASFVIDRPSDDALLMILEIPNERADRGDR
jgi:LytS/YehU family sensor histidine kinase